MHGNGVDLMGQVFGRWKVIGLGVRTTPKALGIYWLCECECGTQKNVAGTSLRRNHSRSCGCLLNEFCATLSTISKGSRTHGASNTQTYETWTRIKQRCLNPRNPNYKDYGGRGISICERWLKFENFLADMGECPHSLEIDRINNDGNYEPSNCRWTTRSVQNKNTRRNHFLTFDSKTLCVADWARLLNVDGPTLQSRITRGWSAARALTTPGLRKLAEAEKLL